jgi:diazepam-binding inhibitor (GABA receptor modulator, acyl-CoA-binding protein)
MDLKIKNGKINFMTLVEQFEQAKVESKQLTEKPSNETLLALYSLYKQGHEGDATSEYEGMPFDFVAKAKWDAWNDLRGKTKEAAQQAYIDLVEKLKG